MIINMKKHKDEVDEVDADKITVDELEKPTPEGYSINTQDSGDEDEYDTTPDEAEKMIDEEEDKRGEKF